MFNWLRGDKGQTSGNAPPPSPETAAPVPPPAAAVPAAEKPAGAPPVLMPKPFVRMEPELAAEIALAQDFAAQAKQCRQKFSDPSFDLPMLPSSAMKVLNLIQDTDVSPRKIAQALQQDPVLTAKFLRLANSPFYAGARKVESVQYAIDRLGLSTVKNVVLTIALNSTVIRDKRLGQSALSIWDHANACAMASQALAARLDLSQSTAFVLGLMHDIGKLPAWIMINDLAAKKPGVRFPVLETLVEDHHVEIGAVLVTVWGMPREVSISVGGHHVVNSIEDANCFVIKNLADVAISECNLLSELLACVTVADRALSAIGMSPEPGDLNVSGPGLMNDLGLNEVAAMEYLAALPAMFKDNKMADF